MREEATVALEADQILNRELEDPVFGTDAASRALRRRKRERSNVAGERRTASGVLATLFGGLFWGFSGTCADFLFENYARHALACLHATAGFGRYLSCRHPPYPAG